MRYRWRRSGLRRACSVEGGEDRSGDEGEKGVAEFHAVVEDQFDEGDKAVKTVLAFLEDEKIRVARLREMPMIAEAARRELRAVRPQSLSEDIVTRYGALEAVWRLRF